ncbi:hypothetical protein B0I33_11322 [Prauserella shujinwangii]|uniref:Uncharacterized protein n=1 Tax=Prauserella shujinwangii TaxID=1453103 RepID=A0A2T0LLE7_9PSEU|nr:hypothetical protein [Prauserella shujinwangii]PRX43859.1 hypothetical protein B0I33_11322 [Prauserella shujinwangii]
MPWTTLRPAGETARLLWRFGRRYAVVLRVATLPPVAAPERLVGTLAADVSGVHRTTPEPAPF